MSDLSRRLVEAAALAIHEDWHIPGECRHKGPINDDVHEARIATVAVLRELANTAQIIGENVFSGPRLADLADRIEQDGTVS